MRFSVVNPRGRKRLAVWLILAPLLSTVMGALYAVARMGSWRVLDSPAWLAFFVFVFAFFAFLLWPVAARQYLYCELGDEALLLHNVIGTKPVSYRDIQEVQTRQMGGVPYAVLLVSTGKGRASRLYLNLPINDITLFVQEIQKRIQSH